MCAPQVIRFNVLNAPNNATYLWDIGKGATSGADTIYGYYTAAELINAKVEIKLGHVKNMGIRQTIWLI